MEWSEEVEWSVYPPVDERLSLPAELEDLKTRYLDIMDGREQFKTLLEKLAGHQPDNCLIERDYIDEDFRDEYAHFYAQTYPPIPERCHRLHFSRGDDDYLGFSVIRPIPGRIVSRTMLRPPPSIVDFVSCLAPASASPYGGKYDVEAMPFISQDAQYGVCAHAAIWMVAQYFHLRWQRHRWHLSDIVRATQTGPRAHRLTPSRGLTRDQFVQALDHLGMRPISYIFGKSDLDNMDSFAQAYLDSGLPVLFPRERHVEVLIGYFSSEGERYYIAHNDELGPYTFIKGPLHERAVHPVAQDPVAGRPIVNAEDEAEVGSDGPTDTGDSEGTQLSLEGERPMLVVPAPGRIYLHYEHAAIEAEFMFNLLLEDREISEHVTSLGIPDGALQARGYASEIAAYKERLGDRLPDDVVSWHRLSSSSHWVWVIELQDTSDTTRGRKCVIGELIFDATSDDRRPRVLFGNLPGAVFRDPNSRDRTEIDQGPSTQTGHYDSGAAIFSPL